MEHSRELLTLQFKSLLEGNKSTSSTFFELSNPGELVACGCGTCCCCCPF